MRDKIKILNHKEELRQYVEVMDDWDIFNSVGNLFINCRRQQWHAQLGKFIYDTYGADIPQDFKKLHELISMQLIDKKVDEYGDKLSTNLSTLAICYIGAYLNTEILSPIFGEPLLHSEFGEGFDEDSHQGEQHASYFLDICGIKVHIGYDHRGARVDVGQYKGETTPAEIAFYLMIELVKAIHKGKKIENENTDKG
jgi:hypothetical protein